MSRILATTLLILIISQGLARANNDTQNTVIVVFKKDVIKFPLSSDTPITDANISIPFLRNAILENSITMRKLDPNFNPENRMVYNRTGELVKLTDISNWYIIEASDEVSLNKLIDNLTNGDETVLIIAKPANYEPQVPAQSPLQDSNSNSTIGMLQQFIPPNDEHYSEQWNLTSPYGINCDMAWTITKGELNTISVGIIDQPIPTGTPRPYHVDLTSIRQ